MQIKRIMAFLCLLLPLIALAEVDCNAMNIGVDGPIARLLPHDFTSLAMYGVVQNNDNVPHTLQSVASKNAASGEFMSYFGPQGPKKLQPLAVDKLKIPAGGQLAFNPGDNHIRLLGYQKLPKPGDKITVVFTFDNGCSKQVTVPVQDRMTPTDSIALSSHYVGA